MLTLQWQSNPGDDTWLTVRTATALTDRPVVIHLGLASAALAKGLQRLVEALLLWLQRMGAGATAAPVAEVWQAGPQGAYRLEAVLGDGRNPVPLEPRLLEALQSAEPTVWVLPLLPSEPSNAAELCLPPELSRQHCLFWQGEAIDDLALSLLARVGITSLDRRVFLSYRRLETQPMADQLFDALQRLNYQVFLDTVSNHPGLDFQAQLFEHLADKSMLVLLHSARFQESPWAMAEVDFALRHNLSLLILRLPDVNDPLPGIRVGDQLVLEADALRRFQHGPPFALKKASLHRIVKRIGQVHDLELVARLVSLQQRILDSLHHHGLTPQQTEEDTAIHLHGSDGMARISLLPTSRPPGLNELHGASQRQAKDYGPSRIVIGRLGAMSPQRLAQLNWISEGRNVRVQDVNALDAFCTSIKEELA